MSLPKAIYAALMTHGAGNLYVHVETSAPSAYAFRGAVWAIVEDPLEQGKYHLQLGDGRNWAKPDKDWLNFEDIEYIDELSCLHCEVPA